MAIPNVVTEHVIASAWGNAVADHVNGLVQRGTYTPAHSGINIGTGGGAGNVGYWQFVGGPNVGDYGFLALMGSIVLGTTGFSVTSSLTPLPPGFAWDPTPDGSMPIGFAHLSDASNGAANVLWNVAGWSATQVRFIGPAAGTLTSGAPFTWAANDVMRWSVPARAARRV